MTCTIDLFTTISLRLATLTCEAGGFWSSWTYTVRTLIVATGLSA